MVMIREHSVRDMVDLELMEARGWADLEPGNRA